MAEHNKPFTSAVVEGQLEKQKISFREIIQKFDGDFDVMVAARPLMEWGLVPWEEKLACAKRGQAMSLSSDQMLYESFTGQMGYDAYVTSEFGDQRRNQKYVACIQDRDFLRPIALALWKILAFGQMWANGVALNVIMLLAELEGQDSPVNWASFCREVVACKFLNRFEKLDGERKTVEINESKFGKQKYNRGQAVVGQWVFGGYERGSGRVFMVPVENRSAETLVPLIEKWILPGTTIHSDFWNSYDGLEEHGYVHMKVNNSLGFEDGETGLHTICVGLSCRAAKSTMPRDCRSRKDMAGSLVRCMFMKQCWAVELDPTSEFFRLAGRLYIACVTTWRSPKNWCDQSKKWASANQLANMAIC